MGIEHRTKIEKPSYWTFISIYGQYRRLMVPEVRGILLMDGHCNCITVAGIPKLFKSSLI